MTTLASRCLAYDTSTPVECLLDCLDGARRTGDGRWMARCPAHDDRSPSLSIRETGDGSVLIHCFAGCGAAEVVQSVGLDLRDLFPPRRAWARGTAGRVASTDRRPPRVPASDVLLMLDDGAWFLEIIAARMATGEAIADGFRERRFVCRSFARIGTRRYER